MAFQVRCNFPRIESYKDASRAWEKGVVFPREPALRGLVDKRKKHLTVEQTSTGDIVLRLYGPDTVTWHPDNSVTIRAYPTRSTAVFANRCTPARMYVTSGGCFRVTVDGRTYRVGNSITFRERDGTWKPDVITPWSVPVINRERARQAYHATGYKEFRLWLMTYVQMARQPDDRSYRWISNEEVVSLLRDRSKWRELVRSLPSVWNNPEETLRDVRHAIHQKYGCIDHTSVPFLG